MATIDDMEALHQEFEAEVSEFIPYVPPIPRNQPEVTRRPGKVLGTVNTPEASKSQLLALREGLCPTCGESSSCFIFDNLMLFYCSKVNHHRFKETLP